MSSITGNKRGALKGTKILLIGVLLLSACGRGAVVERPRAGLKAGSFRVAVLATAHNLHVKEAFGYTYSDLFDQVVAMNPQVVCGEVIAEDLGTREWMYPGETAVVQEAARSVGARFIAADWRPHGFFSETSDAMKAMVPREKKAYNSAYRKFMPRFLKHFGSGLFRFFHSNEAMGLLREAHNTMIQAATDIGAGFWDTRNQMIVKRCMRGAEKNGATRVVFVFGGDHKYGIEHFLHEFYGIRAEPVRALYRHGNREMPPRVIENWRARVATLERELAAGEIKYPLLKAYPARRILKSLKLALTKKGRACSAPRKQ